MMNRDMPIYLPRNHVVWWFTVWLLYRTYKSPQSGLIAAVYFIVIGFILCEIYVSYIKTKLSIVVEKLPEHLNKQEKATLKLKVINHSFLPASYTYIFLKDTYHLVPEKVKCLCVTLPPHSQKEYLFSLQAVNSGKEIVGIEKVIISDFMELARRKMKFIWEQEVIVLPQPVQFKGEEVLLSFAPDRKNDQKNDRQTQVTEEGEVSYDLRPYAEGESQRLMHWKLAAQRDIYMVRQREQIIKLRRERVVVIDPVVNLRKNKLSLSQRLVRIWREKADKEHGEAVARLGDKLVNGTVSYLLQVLKMGESIILYYYEAQKWQCVRLTTLQLLEQMGEKLSGCMIIRSDQKDSEKPSERLPQIAAGNYSQKILLTAGMDAQLKKLMEEEMSFKVLELGKRSIVEESDYNKYWYLTDDYRIVSCR